LGAQAKLAGDLVGWDLSLPFPLVRAVLASPLSEVRYQCCDECFSVSCEFGVPLDDPVGFAFRVFEARVCAMRVEVLLDLLWC
jgi:hypothetical protein